MPRKAREESATGIYHVMIRGINRQDIFEAPEDYRKFIETLASLREVVFAAMGAPGAFSSWGNDYLDLGDLHVCMTESVIRRYTLTELTAWVDMPMPERYGCIDIDERRVIPDIVYTRGQERCVGTLCKGRATCAACHACHLVFFMVGVRVGELLSIYIIIYYIII